MQGNADIKNNWPALAEKALTGNGISRDDALSVLRADESELMKILAAAYRLRRGLAPPSEELMTMARVRTCYKCHAPFYKVEGCNKVRLPTAGCPPALLRALTEPRRAACTILATARGGDHGR